MKCQSKVRIPPTAYPHCCTEPVGDCIVSVMRSDEPEARLPLSSSSQTTIVPLSPPGAMFGFGGFAKTSLVAAGKAGVVKVWSEPFTVPLVLVALT